MSRSLISQAKMVGFSLLYCSIFDTTAGVATLGFDPPIKPGGLRVPAIYKENFCLFRVQSNFIVYINFPSSFFNFQRPLMFKTNYFNSHNAQSSSKHMIFTILM